MPTTPHHRAPATVATPFLAVDGARNALGWYRAAFGATLHGEPVFGTDGELLHAEVDIRGAAVLLRDASPEIGVVAPDPAGVPVTIRLEVDDVDAVLGRAIGAGARLERAGTDHPYGRNGVMRDPFGHRWLIASAPAPTGLRHGDIWYTSLWVTDVERAAAFFGEVLGWRYRADVSPEGRRVEGLSLQQGLFGGFEHPRLFCCYAVRDISAVIVSVLEAGGTAQRAQAEDYGLVANCVDDQGVRFSIVEPPGGVHGQQTRPIDGRRPGDLVGVSMGVADANAARVFYGRCLGWEFVPHRGADSWRVDAVAPRIVVSGGHAVAATIPTYRVDDVGGAVAAVRAAGGSAGAPDHDGIAACTDGQGTRFELRPPAS